MCTNKGLIMIISHSFLFSFGFICLAPFPPKDHLIDLNHCRKREPSFFTFEQICEVLGSIFLLDEKDLF